MNAGISIGATTDGGVAAWLGPSFSQDAVFSQTFSLANTGSYSLQWDSFSSLTSINAPFVTGDTVYNYNVDLSAVGGNSIFNSNFGEVFDGLATSHSVPLNATSGQYTLTFTGIQPISGSAGFIDNVRVVPEPGTRLLAMLGGFGLLLRRRR